MKKWHISGRLKCMSVRKKTSLSLILVSLFLSAFTTICSYRLATQQVEQISMRLSEQSIVAVGEDLSAKIGLLCDSANQLVHMDELREVAEAETFDEADAKLLRAEKKVQTAVNNIIYPQGIGDTVFDFACVYLRNGAAFECQNSMVLPFSDYPECVSYFSKSSPSVADDSYSSARWFWGTVNRGKTRVVVYLRFVYEPVTMRKIGIAVFGILEDWIAEQYTNHLPSAFLLSRDGVVLSAEEKAAVGTVSPLTERLLQGSSGQNRFSRVTVSADGEKIETFCYSLQNINAIMVVPFDFYQTTRANAMLNYFRSIVIMTLGAIVIAIIIGISISGGLLRSMNNLVEFAKKVESGDIACRYQPDSNDEIAYLGKHINHMLDEVSKANQQREDELKAKQRMEVQLLQQQINPHLLYNTLDSLLWYLQEDQNDQASALTKSLSEFFKLSLSKGNEWITLERELRLIRHYLEIQHTARYQNIQLICDVEESLYSYPIMKLLLQPIVENAVLHGFSGYRDDGTIHIEALRQDNVLEITVTDNGIGIQQEELEEIRAMLRADRKEQRQRSFGLYNINQRIVQTCGPDYGLSIESEISEYTTVRIRLPYSRDQEENNHECHDH